jgi:hypothetical protein
MTSFKICTITNQIHGADSLRSRQSLSYSKTSQNFMELEGISQCLQQPAIGPYPELHESSPYHPHTISLRSILILYSHLRLGLPSGLFPPSFPTKTLYSFLFALMRGTCPAHLILLDMIIRIKFSEQYKS